LPRHEVGIGNRSDSFPGRQLDDRYVETQTGEDAVDDYRQRQKPENGGQRRIVRGIS